ncbi:MAG: tripartite tricarboxylate transporter TctB family protein [Pseudomonadales bacterium]|nr:tripartite tricarboxylate transporter TctB family protein [Pseudomonadales bacterium]
MNLLIFRAVSLTLLALFCIYLYFSGDIYLDFWAEDALFHARSFPYVIGIAGVFIAALLTILPTKPVSLAGIDTSHILPAVLLVALTSAFGLLLDYLGFIVASWLFLVSGFLLLGERAYIRIVVCASLLVGIFWLLMDLLEIYLAPGYWLEWLFNV